MQHTVVKCDISQLCIMLQYCSPTCNTQFNTILKPTMQNTVVKCNTSQLCIMLQYHSPTYNTQCNILLQPNMQYTVQYNTAAKQWQQNTSYAELSKTQYFPAMHDAHACFGFSLLCIFMNVACWIVILSHPHFLVLDHISPHTIAVIHVRYPADDRQLRRACRY